MKGELGLNNIDFSTSDITINYVNLAFRKRSFKGWSLENKSRALWGLAYVVDGSATYYYGNKCIEVKSGDVLFLKKGLEYKSTSDNEDYEYIVINFDVTNDDELNSLPIEVLAGNFKHLKHMFCQMEDYWFYKDVGHIIMCKALILQILYTLLHTVVYDIMHTRNYTRIAPAADYMKNCYDKNVSIEDLSLLCNMSPSHFRRTFKLIYNMSPIDYLNQIRINMAKDLLNSRMYSVSDIANLTGFHSVYYFSRKFKEIVGLSPKNFAS